MYKDKSAMFLYYWHLIAPDGEEPVPEFRFAPPRRWRFDWAFMGQKLAVEVEGNAWVKGGGKHMRDSDLDKYNQATVLGWRILRFSPGMLSRDPAGCVDLVQAALQKHKDENEENNPGSLLGPSWGEPGGITEP